MSELPAGMSMPNADRAVVVEMKVVGYLLNEEHPDGRPKSAFFRGCSFCQRNWDVLAGALREHAVRATVAKVTRTVYGVRYTLVGRPSSPGGRTPVVVTVWIVEDDRDAQTPGLPRLVTAYPWDRERR